MNKVATQNLTEEALRASLDQLHASQAMLARAQQIAHLGHWEYQFAEGHYAFSDELYRIFGYEPQCNELDIARLRASLHPDDQHLFGAFQRHLAQVKHDDEVQTLECRLIRRDATVRWAQVDVSCQFDASGKLDQLFGTILDVTERKLLETHLKYYERIASSSTDLIAFVNSDLEYVVTNDAYVEITGQCRERVIGHRVRDVVGKDFFEAELRDSFTTCLSGQVVHEQRWHHFPNLGRRHLDISYIPNHDDKGRVNGFVVNMRDTTENKRAEQQLSYQATHDDLTGLVNRREFERRVERLLESTSSAQDVHALCFLDLDQFKVVNDTCGHVAGDELLRQLTAVLQKVVRKRDTLARLGGDEFGILMEHCSIEDAMRVAESVRLAVQEYQFSWDTQNFKVGASIGLVTIDEHTTGLSELMKKADAACYMAKEQGRNRINVYSPQDLDLARREGEMQWVSRIHQALDENRFCLYAQKIVPIDGSSDTHQELLIRILDTDGRTIPPGSFLPAAERFGVASRLDRWVIQSIFTLMKNNPQALGEASFFAINLSGQSLAEPDFLDFVIHSFQTSKVDGGRICFEITETAAISNLAVAHRMIESVKALGCHFALDDFGSGLSSFGYLKTLPVDFLKIDGMFVKDIVDDPIDRAMVRSINEIGQVMGLKTIAEFVENDAILEKLKEAGVNYAQGYGVSKPMPLWEALGLAPDAPGTLSTGAR